MNKPIDTQVRPEVRDVLSSLKSKIRLYVLVQGLALILVVLGLLFWISFSIDWAWYLFSKWQLQEYVTQYELSTWFRVLFDVLAIGTIIAAACYWIGLRPFRAMRSKALALVLERRFPGLNDRIVTSVELADSVSGRESPLTVSMLNRTVEAARQDATRIRVSEVFETKPIRLAVVGAVFAVISVACYGVADGDDLRRWAQAYLGLDQNYWQRETQLNLQVIASPNERIREFEDVESDGKTRRVFKHPRGGDLTLLVTVPEGLNFNNEPYVVPEEVKIVYQVVGEDGELGATKSAACTPIGKKKFKFSIGQVVNGMKLWTVGGDFKNRVPYEIELVDPPETVAMGLECIFPAYTGMNNDPTVESYVEVRGKQVSVPLETRFLFQVETNKPLYDTRLEFGRYQLEFGSVPASREIVDGKVTYQRKFRANLKSKGLDDVTARLLSAAVGPGFTEDVKNADFRFPISEERARRFFHPDGKGFDLPFIVSDRASDAARSRFERRYQNKPEGPYFPIRREEGGELIELGMPFVMSPGADLRIYLEDTDEIASTDPGKVTINVDRDQPPEIKDLVREGIGVAVTANAEIPIAAKISDDYGIVSASFEYRVAVSDKAAPGPWETWDFDNAPDSDNPPKEFVLSRSDLAGKKENVERFPVSQIKLRDESIKVEGVDQFRDLRPGDVLTLSVVAKDGDRLNGPHVTRSVPLLTFRIVTDDELFFLLRQKETGIRLKFEKVIEEIERMRSELDDRLKLTAELRDVRNAAAKDGRNAASDKKIADLERRIKLTASRSKAQIVENRNETKLVQKGFEDIRAELVNNKLFTEKQAQRIDVEIIKVLVDINEDDYPLVIGALNLYNDAVNNAAGGAGITKDPTDDIQLCLDRTDAMLVRMRAALEKMVKTQKIGKVIEMLYLLTKDQKDLKKKTAELRRIEELEQLKKLQELQNGPKQ